MSAEIPVLQNFRVSRIKVSLEAHTVVATSQQDAVTKVEQGFGAHAGAEGPVVFAAIAQDRAALPTAPTLQSVLQELQTGWALLEAMREQARRQGKPAPVAP